MLVCLAGLVALLLMWTEVLALMSCITCATRADAAINAQTTTLRRAKILGLAVMMLL